MLYRCSPRSSTSAVSGNGNASTSVPFVFPVKNAASSCSVPRATVSSTSGRALEPFLKNMLSRSGIAFGWLCMSCRQPVSAASTQNPASASERPDLGPRTSELDALRLNFAYPRRIESLQEIHRLTLVELRVRGFHEQEEAVAARVLREALHVEDRVIRHRQAVEHDHPDDRGQRREENRQLEGHRHVLRPAVERLARDVDRIRDLVHPL